MSDTSVIAILASVGIFLAGSVTADAAALAGAVQQANPTALEDFVFEHPESNLAPDALWLAAEISHDKPTDSASSSDNPKLTCNLNITRLPNGKAEVTWTISGAADASLTPLGFKKGTSIPLKGSKTIDYDDYLRVGLTAKDSAGHEINCSVVLNSSSTVTNGSTGLGSPYSVDTP